MVKESDEENGIESGVVWGVKRMVLFIVGDHGSRWLGFVHLHGHLEAKICSWDEGLRSSHQVMAWMAKILHLEGCRKILG